MTRVLAIVAAFVLASGCESIQEPPYLTGTWGGQHIGIAFQGGLADVRFDCAAGSIDELIFAAKGGPFQAKGTYRAGPPGPIRVGQTFVVQPATYSGNVTEKVMTLSVELDDGTQVGPFTLTQGAPAQITRCL